MRRDGQRRARLNELLPGCVEINVGAEAAGRGQLWLLGDRRQCQWERRRERVANAGCCLPMEVVLTGFPVADCGTREEGLHTDHLLASCNNLVHD